MQFAQEIFYIDDSVHDLAYLRIMSARGHFPFALITFPEHDSALLELERRATEQMPMPGMIVVDFYLPGTDGSEVLRTIRSRYPNHDFVLALCSGTDDRDDIENARIAGAEVILEKPLDLEKCQFLLQDRTKG